MVSAEESETTRVEAFSDGVFAIAITLLILELRPPHNIAPGTLGRALAHLWPSYFALLTSFLTVGVMWMNHHRLFSLIGRTDQTLIGLNLLVLLGVSFVPFPTAVVAQHLNGPDGRAAAIFYNATFVVIAIFFNVLWRYASRDHRLLDSEIDSRSVHGVTRQYSYGPLYYLAALLVAFVNAKASVALNIAIAIFFALPARRFHRD